MLFWPMCCAKGGCCVAKVKLFCLKSSVPVTQAGVFIWKNFNPGYRDLGNPASRVDWAHMKRP